jgi:hypothetical protein
VDESGGGVFDLCGGRGDGDAGEAGALSAKPVAGAETESGRGGEPVGQFGYAEVEFAEVEPGQICALQVHKLDLSREMVSQQVGIGFNEVEEVVDPGATACVGGFERGKAEHIVAGEVKSRARGVE